MVIVHFFLQTLLLMQSTVLPSMFSFLQSLQEGGQEVQEQEGRHIFNNLGTMTKGRSGNHQRCPCFTFKPSQSNTYSQYLHPYILSLQFNHNLPNMPKIRILMFVRNYKSVWENVDMLFEKEKKKVRVCPPEDISLSALSNHHPCVLLLLGDLRKCTRWSEIIWDDLTFVKYWDNLRSFEITWVNARDDLTFVITCFTFFSSFSSSSVWNWGQLWYLLSFIGTNILCQW